MSDIVERLRTPASDDEWMELMAQRIDAANEIERLRAALRECKVELDAYYRAEYPGDHPYSIKKLKEAMASNPARTALKEAT